MNSDIKKLYRRGVILYLKYKDSQYYSLSLYGGILLVSLLLLFYVIIPQVGSWVSIQEEVAATEKRIAIMNDNLRLYESLHDAQLQDDFDIATQALPPDRNIARLLGAINYAAIEAGVGMEDFSFQGGEISSRSTENQGKDQTTNLTFAVIGSTAQISTFLTEIQQKMPLIAVSSIDAQFSESNIARVSISFHYKPLPLIPDDDASPVGDLSGDNKQLLQTLRSWQIPEEPEFTPIGSESAEPL